LESQSLLSLPWQHLAAEMLMKSFLLSLACVEAARVQIKSQDAVEDVLELMISKLDKSSQAVAKEITKTIPQISADSKAKLQALNGKCPAKWSRFTWDDLHAELKTRYKNRPFSCAGVSGAAAAWNRLKGKWASVDNVLPLFGQNAGAAQRQSMPKLMSNCILQDMVETYGKSDGLIKWDTNTLKKFPGMQQTLTAYFRLARKGDVKVWDKSVFNILKLVWRKLAPAYTQSKGANKYFLYEYLKKSFLISFGNVMAVRANGDMDKLNEILPGRPASLYDNIEWAVDFENNGVKLGHKFADSNNVALGREVMKLFGYCLDYYYDSNTHVRLRGKSGDLLERAVLLYTIWNYRYITYFVSQNPTPGQCGSGNSWSPVPLVATHAVVSLIGGTAIGGLEGWLSYRGITLMCAGYGIQQDCSGKVMGLI